MSIFRITKKWLILFCAIPFLSYGQQAKFAKVIISDFLKTKDSIFKNADAVILHRSVENEVGNYIEVTERRRIYTKEGYKYANIKIPHSSLSWVQGKTYNLEDGVLVVQALDKQITSGEETEKVKDLRILTFPNVKEGSIIEYSYRAARGTFQNMMMQYDIPVRYIDILIRNGSPYNYNILQNPRATLNIKSEKIHESTRITYSNVPALEEEPYSLNTHLFRSYLEISVTGNARRMNFSTFEKYVDILLETDDFTNGFKPVKAYKKEVEKLLIDTSDKIEKIKKVYDFVSSRMQWNGGYGIFPDNESARFAYKSGRGDAADINMLLVSILKSIGMNANPVLVSTRANGIPLTPSDTVFNYIIAVVHLDDSVLLLDAVQDESSFYFLPRNVVNWKGLEIKNSGMGEWLDLRFSKMSQSTLLGNFVIQDDLSIEGSMRFQLTGYSAADLQSEIHTDVYDTFKKSQGFNEADIEITQLKNIANDTINNKTSWSYKFEKEDAVEPIGNKLYFNPLPLYGLDRNPFVKEERKLPINFGYPFQTSYSFTIDIPEGYEIDFVPESLKMSLPDNAGDYLFSLQRLDRKIKVLSRFNLKISEIPVYRYEELKKFFQLMTEKETENVVLSKI